MNMIRDISIRAHVWALGLCRESICLVVRRRSHCWMVTRRLLISRPVDGNRRVGNMTIAATIGRPAITGVMKEANRFSFI